MEINGEPWFVATDVYRALDISQAGSNFTYLQADETQTIPRGIASGKGMTPEVFEGHSRSHTATIITEAGLYKLIMRSPLPSARLFQDWVTRVVLPAIRKDGGSETTNRRTPHDNHRTL